MTKSRNARSYVKAMLKYRKVRARLDVKLAKLKPLEDQVEAANQVCRAKYLRLSGGQIAEADRLLSAADADVLALLAKPCKSSKTEDKET